MADRTFLSLEPQIAPSVPGCPAPTIETYVRAAAIEVCERTQAWRHQQDDITLVAGTHSYAYVTPTGSEVCGITHMALNGNKINFVTQEELHDCYPDWPSTDTTKRSRPQIVSQFHPDNFIVAPVPDSAETYTMKMFLVLRPTPASTGMEEIVFDELERVIVHGALQRMLVLPDRSWTDNDLAGYHAKQFSYRLASRRAKASLGLGRASLSVQMNPLT
ncbi:hypothetical protein [uncultured Paraglaciecola sp.]|uniref:hypothetical protein n=1 Tax=uncultured Paraglaciecola sp. TaxID=1765024 RepID=UPI00262CE1C4|nr:hypothetical protein [uncultured Paraglaciecola sp.]